MLKRRQDNHLNGRTESQAAGAGGCSTRRQCARAAVLVQPGPGDGWTEPARQVHHDDAVATLPRTGAAGRTAGVAVEGWSTDRVWRGRGRRGLEAGWWRAVGATLAHGRSPCQTLMVRECN